MLCWFIAKLKLGKSGKIVAQTGCDPSGCSPDCHEEPDGNGGMTTVCVDPGGGGGPGGGGDPGGGGSSGGGSSGGGSSGGGSSGSGVDNYEPPPYTEPTSNYYPYESYDPPQNDPVVDSSQQQDTASQVINNGGDSGSFGQDLTMGLVGSIGLPIAESIVTTVSEIVIEAATAVGNALLAVAVGVVDAVEVGVLLAGSMLMASAAIGGAVAYGIIYAIGGDPIDVIRAGPPIEIFPLSDPVPDLIPSGFDLTPVIDSTILSFPTNPINLQDLVLTSPFPDAGVSAIPPLITPLDSGTSFLTLLAAELVPASEIHFSQEGIKVATSNGIMLDDLAQNIASGWRGDPIRVYETPTGELVSVDNRRLAAAKLIDAIVPIERISTNDPIIQSRDGIRDSIKVRNGPDSFRINMSGGIE